jgi:hypothetical protein
MKLPEGRLYGNMLKGSMSDSAIWRESRIPTGDMGASRNRSCKVNAL